MKQIFSSAFKQASINKLLEPVTKPLGTTRDKPLGYYLGSMKLDKNDIKQAVDFIATRQKAQSSPVKKTPQQDAQFVKRLKQTRNVNKKPTPQQLYRDPNLGFKQQAPAMTPQQIQSQSTAIMNTPVSQQDVVAFLFDNTNFRNQAVAAMRRKHKIFFDSQKRDTPMISDLINMYIGDGLMYAMSKWNPNYGQGLADAVADQVTSIAAEMQPAPVAQLEAQQDGPKGASLPTFANMGVSSARLHAVRQNINQKANMKNLGKGQGPQKVSPDSPLGGVQTMDAGVASAQQGMSGGSAQGDLVAQMNENKQGMHQAIGQLPPDLKTIINVLLTGQYQSTRQQAKALNLPLQTFLDKRNRAFKMLRQSLNNVGITQQNLNHIQSHASTTVYSWSLVKKS